MLTTQPLVTIGITCFNDTDTIERAVLAALQQQYPNFEILVVDDCSVDKSVEVIERLQKQYPQVRLARHNVNKGYPSALNTIINNASGDYIAFFDDDDDSRPDRLESQLQRIMRYVAEHGNANVFCYSNREVRYTDDIKPSYSFKAIGRVAPEPNGMEVADYLLWDTGDKNKTWGMFGSCTLMVRKDTLQSVGGFDPQFRRCAEWDIAIRAAFQGAHFIAVNEPLVIQYKTPTADKKGAIPLKYSMMLRDKHQSYLKEKGVYIAARQMARSRYYGGKAKPLLAKFYLMTACLAAPVKLLGKRLSGKFIKSS